MIWLIPFWLLMMIPAVDLISVNRLGQAGLMVLMAPSVFSAWHPFEAPWKQPWLFDALRSAGRLRQYDEPPLKYEAPRHSWLSQLPTSAGTDADYWVELSGTGVDGSAITLRVADGGLVSAGERRGRRIRFVWNQGRAIESATSVIVDQGVVADGENFPLLLWPDGNPPADELFPALELVCGLPAGADPQTGSPVLPQYSLAAKRYQRLRIREDAFLCDTGVGWSVRQTTAPGIPAVSLRSECWNTPELPFGIANWEVQTRDYGTGAVLAVRRLTVVRAGKFLEPPRRDPSQ
jgi:hypothetical protein